MAGKSTAVSDFAEASAIDWQIRSKTVTGSNPIRDLAESLKRDTAISDTTRGWMYYASFRADIDLMLPPTTPTIQESVTAFRSIAFHSVLGDPAIASEFMKNIDCLDIFSSSFIFTATLRARQERFEHRLKTKPASISPMDLLVRDQPGKFMLMEEVMLEAVKRASPNAIIIDTTSNSRSEVVDIIAEQVNVSLRSY